LRIREALRLASRAESSLSIRESDFKPPSKSNSSIIKRISQMV
jgi:hypothetical protein